MDAFVKLKVPGNKTLKTKIITLEKGKTEVVWNKQFVFPIQVPVFDDVLKLQVWDQNDSGKEDLILGSIPI